MSYDHAEQQRTNQAALDNPQPGDYWQEMFHPYFLVVQVKSHDHITVLNCLSKYGPDAVTRVDAGHWMFDVSQSMVVDQAWIRDRVCYSIIDGFVADVVQGREKFQAIVDEWIKYQGKKLIKELQALGPEVSRQLLMEQW
jgi:hypothetical protein